MSDEENRTDPYAGEFFCGDFPGASGHPLRNYVHVFWSDWRCEAGWHWWNAKEGNGHCYSERAFATAKEAFDNAKSFYPLLDQKQERYR